MASLVDVTGPEPADARGAIVEALADAGPGEVVSITAEQDPEPALYQAQIGHDRVLTWSSESDDQDPHTVRVRVTEDASTEPVAFDVRTLPPTKRHAVPTETVEQLDPGQSFVLVNDHDPKPLYHQFDAEAGPEFRWAYRQREPGEFRVLIGRADVQAGERPASTGFDAPF